MVDLSRNLHYLRYLVLALKLANCSKMETLTVYWPMADEWRKRKRKNLDWRIRFLKRTYYTHISCQQGNPETCCIHWRHSLPAKKNAGSYHRYLNFPTNFKWTKKYHALPPAVIVNATLLRTAVWVALTCESYATNWKSYRTVRCSCEYFLAFIENSSKALSDVGS